MLQTPQNLTPYAPGSFPAPDHLAADPPPHVDALTWQLATPAERAALMAPPPPANTTTPSAVTASLRPATEDTPVQQAQRLRLRTFWELMNMTRKAARTPVLPQAGATPVAASIVPAAPLSGDQAAIVRLTDQFRARFAEAAQDPARFDAMLRTAFGENHDREAAEGLRQKALNNDFSWLPKIELKTQAELGAQGVSGAYNQDSNTVFIDRGLLEKDPAAAEKLISAQIGQAIDRQINATDAAGNEGKIFAALLHGEKIDPKQLAAWRAEVDHGTLMVDGVAVQVDGLHKPAKKKRRRRRRFGRRLRKAFKKVGSAIKKGIEKAATIVKEGLQQAWEVTRSVVKAAVDFAVATIKATVQIVGGLLTGDMDQVKAGASAAVNAVKDVAKAAYDTVMKQLQHLKERFIEIMQSKFLSMVMMVAQYIPIPIIQAVARVYQLAKAVYLLVQAIKAGSIGGALVAAAGVVGGAASFAGSLGAAASVVNGMKNVATGLQVAGQAYTAVAQKNILGAVALVSQAVGAPQQLTDGLKVADKVATTVKAAKDGDILGAVASGAGALATAGGTQTAAGLGVGSDTTKVLDRVASTAGRIDQGVDAVKTGQYGDLAHLAAQEAGTIGRDLGAADTVGQLADAVEVSIAGVRAARHGDVTGLLDSGSALTGGALGERLGLDGGVHDGLVFAADQAHKGEAAIRAARHGDVAALEQLAHDEGVALGFDGPAVQGVLHDYVEAVDTARAGVLAARHGDATGATRAFADLAGGDLAHAWQLDASIGETADRLADGTERAEQFGRAVRDGDVREASQLALGTAGELGLTLPLTRGQANDLLQTAQQIDHGIDAARHGRAGDALHAFGNAAASDTAGWLGADPDIADGLHQAADHAEDTEQLVGAVRGRDASTASAILQRKADEFGIEVPVTRDETQALLETGRQVRDGIEAARDGHAGDALHHFAQAADSDAAHRIGSSRDLADGLHTAGRSAQRTEDTVDAVRDRRFADAGGLVFAQLDELGVPSPVDREDLRDAVAQGHGAVRDVRRTVDEVRDTIDGTVHAATDRGRAAIGEFENFWRDAARPDLRAPAG